MSTRSMCGLSTVAATAHLIIEGSPCAVDGGWHNLIQRLDPVSIRVHFCYHFVPLFPHFAITFIIISSLILNIRAWGRGRELLPCRPPCAILIAFGFMFHSHLLAAFGSSFHSLSLSAFGSSFHSRPHLAFGSSFHSRHLLFSCFLIFS